MSSEENPASEQPGPAKPDDLRNNMMHSIVTEPLLKYLQDAENDDTQFDVIIALNELFKDGIGAALEFVKNRGNEWHVPYSYVSQYLFCRLTKWQILFLAKEARDLTSKYGPQASVIYRIWDDTDIHVSLNKSLVTVKADAAQRAFRALGDEIVWAVLDSGVQGDHPHFNRKNTVFGPIDTLNIPSPLKHMDFTLLQNVNGAETDAFGHGTHVAGIIAGYWEAADAKGEWVVGSETRDELNSGNPIQQLEKLHSISGVAPLCKIVSLKVIADTTVTNPVQQTAGKGKVSWVLQAIEQIQQWNQNGKRLLIHGVNMSLGYDFDPRWFACGQSPICVEVCRLIKTGVVVVVSAGNSGYGTIINSAGMAEARYNDSSITDPGNAELAITVGSTHREKPHVYGVSYFSSRGPTGDGRMKPDLVAPGERIVSCAAGKEAGKFSSLKDGNGNPVSVLYCELSGTSMAAPHVSGATAAFLSVRKEFIGQPERVKEILMNNTVDLRRERNFQGAGMLDLMKVLQAV